MHKSTKIAIVTGGGRGIGQAIGVRLMEDGYFVIAVDILFKNSIFDKQVTGDVRDLKVISQVKTILDEFNPVRLVLINSAGISIPNQGGDFSLEAWDETLAINLTAPFMWTEAMVPYFSEASSGTVVNISSLGAFLSFPNNPAYDASKAGVVQLTRSYAQKFGSRGITCNAVAPGYIETDMTAISNSNPSLRNKRISRTLLKRLGLPIDVANLVSFLASEQSEYITGQQFIIDGGYSVQGAEKPD